MTMLTIQPTFDMMDEVMLVPGVNSIEEVLKEMNAKYDNVSIRGTGMHVVARDEMVSVMNDSYVATFLSIILILALLYFSFRAWIAPVFTVTPLVIWYCMVNGYNRSCYCQTEHDDSIRCSYADRSWGRLLHTYVLIIYRTQSIWH